MARCDPLLHGRSRFESLEQRCLFAGDVCFGGFFAPSSISLRQQDVELVGPKISNLVSNEHDLAGQRLRHDATGSEESGSRDEVFSDSEFLAVLASADLKTSANLTQSGINDFAVESGAGHRMVEPFEDVVYYGGSRDWYLNAINAPEVWAHGFSGQGVVAAVLDTGVDYTHDDLDDNIWTNEDEIPENGVDDDDNGYVDDVRGWDFYNRDNDPFDESGHGTHVAGIIAAESNRSGSTGIAHSVKIMALQVLGGEEGAGSNRDIARAIRYAVDNGADVINMSLGGGGASRSIQRAIEYASERSVLIVAAAGNEYDNSPGYPAAYSASYSNVISVSAFDRSNDIADFGNSVGRSGAVQVDAPGVRIYSTSLDNRYATYSGTSMSAPMVSGLAALILSADQTLRAEELRDLIVEGAGLVIGGSDSAGGIDAALSVAIAYGAVAPQIVVPGDINLDGFVNFTDFLILTDNFGRSSVTRVQGDLSEDGLVSFADFLELSMHFDGTITEE